MTEVEAKILIDHGFPQKITEEFKYLLESKEDAPSSDVNRPEGTIKKHESFKLNMDKSGNLGLGAQEFQKTEGIANKQDAKEILSSNSDVSDTTNEVELDLSVKILNELYSAKKIKKREVKFENNVEASRVKLENIETSGEFLVESGKGVLGIFHSFFISMGKREISDWKAFPSSIMQIGLITLVLSLVLHISPLENLLFYDVNDLLKAGSILLLLGLFTKILLTLSISPSESEVQLWKQDEEQLNKAIADRKLRNRVKQNRKTEMHRPLFKANALESIDEIKNKEIKVVSEGEFVEELEETEINLSELQFSKEQDKDTIISMTFEDDTIEFQESNIIKPIVDTAKTILKEDQISVQSKKQVFKDYPERVNAKGKLVLLSDGTEVRQTQQNYYTPASLYKRLVPLLPTHNTHFKDETIILPPEDVITEPTIAQILKADQYLEYFKNALRYEFSVAKQPEDLESFKFKQFIERGTHYCGVFKRFENITVKELINHKIAIANYFKQDEDLDKTMKIQFQSSGTYVYLFVFKFYGVADGIEGIDMRVTIGDVLSDPKMYKKFLPKDIFKGTDIQMPLGYTDSGTVISNSYYDDPHGLTSGETGSGKSWTIGTSLYYLAAITNPADNRFILFDPGDTLIYRELAKLPHTIGYIQGDAVNTGKLNNLLKLYIDLFEDRSRLFSEVGVEDISMYNKKFPNKKLPYIFLFIDEVNSLSQDFDDNAMFKEFKDMVLFISAKLRKYGAKLHLIPQRPVEPFVTKTTREQLKRRIFLNPNVGDIEKLFNSDSSDLKGLEFAGQGSGLLSCTKMAEMKKMQFTLLGATDTDFFGTMNSISSAWNELGSKTTYEPMMLQLYRILNHFDGEGNLMTWQKKILRDFKLKELKIYDRARENIFDLSRIQQQQDDNNKLQVGKKSSFILDTEMVLLDESGDVSKKPELSFSSDDNVEVSTVSDKDKNIIDNILGVNAVEVKNEMTLEEFILFKDGEVSREELLDKFGLDGLKEAILNLVIKPVEGDLNKFKLWK